MTRTYPNGLTRFTTPRFTLSDITPLTYRDGESYASLLWRLFRHITEVLNPSLETSFRELITQLEAEMVKAEQQYVDGVQEFQRIHDAFMSDVNAHLIALNDGTMSDLVEDSSSLLGSTLREVFPQIQQLQRVSVDVVAFGAIGDGYNDDTEAIQAAIDYTSTTYGGGQVYVPAGHYMVKAHGQEAQDWSAVYSSGGIQLRDNVTLTLNPKAILEAIPTSQNTYNLVGMLGISGARVEGGTLLGERDHHIGSGGEWGHGIAIIGSHNITVSDVEIRGMWGDGIYVGLDDSREHGTNIVIEHCVMNRNRRQGVSVVAGHDVTIKHCHISDIRGTIPEAGIDIEPNTGNICTNITVIHNTLVGNNHGVMVNNTYGVMRDVKVHSNTIEDSRTHGIFVLESEDVNITGNHIDRSGRHSIRVNDTVNAHVQANVCVSAQNGIGAYNTARCSVVENTVLDAGTATDHFGVFVTASQDAVVQGNTVKGCSGNGIVVTGSTDSAVQHNTVFDSGHHGVQVYGGSVVSRRNIVSHNIIRNSGNNNISVYGGHDEFITSNLLSGGANRSEFGDSSRHVQVQESHGVTILGNMFRGGGAQLTEVGLYIHYSADNTLVSGNDFYTGSVTGVTDLGTNTVLQSNRLE